MSYFKKIKDYIRQVHGCDSWYVDTVDLKGLAGDHVKYGQVEVFTLGDHPKAKRCYAWWKKRDDNQDELARALGLPSVDSAEKAVLAEMARQGVMRILESGQPTVVHTDPEILSGIPVFVGTRVPIQNFLDYVNGGESIQEFLEDFPTVSMEQVLAVLESYRQSPSTIIATIKTT